MDPFLAQYIRPVCHDHQQLYFKSLNKQSRIKSFDYYRQYLTQNKSEAGSPTRWKLPNENFPKPPSPLSKEAAVDDGEPMDTSTGSLVEEAAEQNISTRRRRESPLNSQQSSEPLKKLHSQVRIQVLSDDVMDCQLDDLIVLISRMLQSLINLNDQSVPECVANPHADTGLSLPEDRKKVLTRYHSRTPPGISVETYLSRLTKFNNFTQTTLLTTIYYIDLLSHNFQPYFTLNSWTVHRFLLVATMMAQKSLEDFFYTNEHYSKVGGVALSELNCLELDFLHRVDWKLIPARQVLENKTSIKYCREVLELYYTELVTLMGRNVSEQSNTVYKLADPRPSL